MDPLRLPVDRSLDELSSALQYLRPGAAIELVLRADGPYLTRYAHAQPVPTMQELARGLAEYAEAAQAAADRQRQNQQKIKTTLQTTLGSAMVGKTFAQLTNAERQNLLLAILYKLEVIDHDTNIRPFEEWL